MKQSFFIVLIFILLPLQSFSQIRLTGKTITGETVNLEELLKKGPVLINFWATWCQPCKAEMRHLKLFYEKYKESGFTIIGVNQDSPKSLSKVNSFISSSSILYPIVPDPNSKIFEMFNGQVMPFNLLIDRNGKIAYQSTGYLTGDEEKLETEILKLIENK